MINIVGISGSLRQASFNAGLLRAAAESTPEGCTISVNSIRGIPLYDAEVEENEGIPAKVVELKDAIAAADGLLLVTPEYNNSMPGVFKNAIDWISRPPEDRRKIFFGRPVGLIGATPGSFGTAFSQYAWMNTLRVLNTQVWSGRLLWVSSSMKKFDKQGNLTDETTRKQLKKYVAGFADFVAQFEAR